MPPALATSGWVPRPTKPACTFWRLFLASWFVGRPTLISFFVVFCYMRIVSTLPSATEIICALGLESELVAVSYECEYPPSVRDKPKVVRSLIDTSNMTQEEIDAVVSEHYRKGRPLYVVDNELLVRLRPDLIVTQDLCDVCALPSAAVVDALGNLAVQTRVPEVLTLRPHSLEDVFQDILRVGRATGRVGAAERLVSQLRARVERIRMLPPTGARVVCLEWLEPPYNAGQWMPELVEYAGAKELLGTKGQDSHRISWQDVAEAEPDYIFVAPCGYNIPRTLRELGRLLRKQDWGGRGALSRAKVFVMDAAYYSTPGPRLVDGLEALAAALRPDSMRLPENIGVRVEVARLVAGGQANL